MTDSTERNDDVHGAKESSAVAEAKAEEIKEDAGAQADAMLDEAEQQRQQAAAGLDRGAKEIHDRSEKAKELGKQAGEQAAVAGHRVAEGMQSTARYVQEHSTQDLTKTATKYVQEHPVQAGLGALLTLFVFWRIVK